ncbi:MAG: ABC transporter permease [Clostridiaceae bacterium]|nr:ABC transporter permease [Clostridiaceae bacterium]
MGILRIKASIKVTFKGIFAQWKFILLVYAILPLLLSITMGYFQKGIFQPETTIDKINIRIIDEDNSKTSQAFIEVFETEGLKKLFNLTNKGEYVLTIPKGYEDSISKLKETTIRVDEKERTSRSNEIIIKSIVNQYGKSVTETLIISNKIEALNIQDKEKIFNEVISSLTRISGENALKTNILKGERTLNSFENQAASMMTFMLFIIVMGCVGAYHLDKENGCFRRLISTPITKATFFNLDLLIFFISSFIYGLIYILSFRVTGLAFKGINPINILAILTGQSLLITALSGLVIAFLSKQNSNIVVIIFMYFQIIFGGAFIPIKEVSSEVFTLLSKFSPGNVISNAYKQCILFNSFEKLVPYLLIMLIVSIVIYIISILKVKIRWEE